VTARIGRRSVLDCELCNSGCSVGVDCKKDFEQLTVGQHVLIHTDDEAPERTRPDGGCEQEFGRLSELIARYQLNIKGLFPLEVELQAANRLTSGQKCG
jgi:hypothetical protein